MNTCLRAVAVLIGVSWSATAAAETFDCILSPLVTVRVGSPVPGVIDRVVVAPGDLVAEGQEIATLRSEVERTTVALGEEQASNVAEFEAHTARLDLARRKLERKERLVTQRVATGEEVETARAEVEVISRELAIAEMRRRMAELELRRAREILAQRTIRSPVNGVVVERALYSGEFIHQEGHVVSIAQIDPLLVEAYLPARAYSQVSVGMPATVFPEEPADRQFAAEVTVVDRVFDAASGTFGIQLQLANPAFAIPAGQRCTLDLAVTTASHGN